MNILHVDDSPEICQLYADILSLGNNCLTSVNEGRQGLELALKNDYDLILLDICMPKYSGMEFIYDIKAQRPSGPCTDSTRRCRWCAQRRLPTSTRRSN